MPKAKKDLYIGFTKVHNEGDEVSAERVKQYGWEDQVEGSDKKATAKAEEKKPE